VTTGTRSVVGVGCVVLMGVALSMGVFLVLCWVVCGIGTRISGSVNSYTALPLDGWEHARMPSNVLRYSVKLPSMYE
jgi:hypothetical protein